MNSASRPSPQRIRLIAPLSMALCLLLIWSLFPALGRPTPALAATSVGLGSYTTVLPPGGSLPSNNTGGVVAPKITSNVTGAIPTNDWWSSLVFQRYAGNP
ncbi:MAG TPA: hypothetical protein VGE07_05715, partial [Herpetosiphonaceae bacterium]